MADKVELIEVPGKWEIPYMYSAGEVMSRFFIELRDNARIMATKCPQCQRVFLPPRSFCERCFISIKDRWMELEPRGELRAFTVVYQRTEGAPEPPYIACYVNLGASSTTIPQYLNGVKANLSNMEEVLKEVKIGMPIRAVFKEKAERRGRIVDFCIEPIKD